MPEEMEHKKGESNFYKYVLFVAGIVLMISTHYYGHSHEHEHSHNH